MRYYNGYVPAKNLELWNEFQKEKNCPVCGSDHILYRRTTIKPYNYSPKREYIYRATCADCKEQWQTPQVERDEDFL